MSGSSLNYFYSRLDGFLDEYRGEFHTPLRKALYAKLKLAVQALHDMEWVDSGDYGPGDDVEAIKAFVEPEFVLETVKQEMKELLATARELVDEQGNTDGK